MKILLVSPNTPNNTFWRLKYALKFISKKAGLPPLDFSGITGKKKKEYIQAIHAGFKEDYRPMEKIFESVIRRTLRARGRR